MDLDGKLFLVSSLMANKNNAHIITSIKSVAEDMLDESRVFLDSPVSVFQRHRPGPGDLLLFVGSVVSESSGPTYIAKTASAFGCKTAFWATDDPYERDANFRSDAFDFFFSNEKNGINLKRHQTSAYLPLAASRDDLLEIQEENLHTGLFFCGAPYENRKLLLKTIVEDTNIGEHHLYASGGDYRSSGLKPLPDISNHRQLLSCYNRFTCTLYSGRSLGLANRMGVVADSPAPRLYECAIAGGVQVAYCVPLSTRDLLSEGEGVLYVDTVHQVEEAFFALMNEQGYRTRIAKAGQAKVITRHLYDHRLREAFDKIFPSTEPGNATASAD